MSAPDSTARFSNRVADYVKWRPGYPPAVLEVLRRECDLKPGAKVADVGSGTGIFSRLLLETGATVYAVEPNAPMRAAAEQALGGLPGFHSIAAPAEATTLGAASVDLVTAAQAFHWFDPGAARTEFARILRLGGAVALIWNDRRTVGTAFLGAYEDLLRRRATDYAKVNHRNVADADFDAFFGKGKWRCATSNYVQRFDCEGFLGRVLSSSYVPAAGQPGHDAMVAELRQLFDAHQESGSVAMAYDTRVYYGRLVSE